MNSDFEKKKWLCEEYEKNDCMNFVKKSDCVLILIVWKKSDYCEKYEKSDYVKFVKNVKMIMWTLFKKWLCVNFDCGKKWLLCKIWKSDYVKFYLWLMWVLWIEVLWIFWTSLFF